MIECRLEDPEFSEEWDTMSAYTEFDEEAWNAQYEAELEKECIIKYNSVEELKPDEDYLKDTACEICNRSVKLYYSVECKRCGFDSYYMIKEYFAHCLDCVKLDEDMRNYGMRTLDGYDLCCTCYENEPHVLNGHYDHEIVKIYTKDMITYCGLCNKFICNECRKTSNSTIKNVSYPNTEYEVQTETMASLCIECISKFNFNST